MFFCVENLGPLRKAEVDLSKQMILLTGPNSTGKTYLAWSVYGLFRAPDATASFAPLVQEILASPSLDVDFDRVTSLWPDVLKVIAKQLSSRLHLCFAAERKAFAGVKVKIVPGVNDLEVGRARSRLFRTGEFQIRVSVGSRVAVQFFKVPKRGAGSGAGARSDREPVSFSHIPADAKQDLVAQLQSYLAWAVVSRFWPDCTLLPTERTAVDMFARELSNRRTDLVNRAVEAQLELNMGSSIMLDELASVARDVGRYPWPIQDSLRMANDLVFFSKHESDFADLATELEILLGGAVALSDEGAIGFRPAGKAPPIGIHLTSSVVKSLVRLVFYFRHLAEKGDLLMIDEPELNLHPDNQRKLARVLSKAMNRGLRLIMSTHSDYFLRELNNLVILSRDTPALREVREKHDYAEAELLPPDKVGVYLFKDGTALDVPVREDGFEVQTIEDEINKMNALSQEIYAALYE